MPKNPPPPTCSKCGKPMHFMLVKTGLQSPGNGNISNARGETIGKFSRAVIKLRA